MTKQKPDLMDLKMVSTAPAYHCPPGHIIVVREGGSARNKKSKGKTEVFGYANGIKVLTYRKAYAILEFSPVSYRTFVSQIDHERGSDLVPVMLITPAGHCLISMCSEFKCGYYSKGGTA